MTFHEGLREGLAALELRRSSRGAEGRDVDGAELVSQTRGKRILWADDDEIDRLGSSERDDSIDVVGFHIVALRQLGNCSASGRSVQRSEFGALVDLPRERVLAPAGTDDQDSQGGHLVEAAGDDEGR